MWPIQELGGCARHPGYLLPPLLLLQQQQLQPLPLLEGSDAVEPELCSKTKGGDSLALSRTSSFQRQDAATYEAAPSLLLGPSKRVGAPALPLAPKKRQETPALPRPRPRPIIILATRKMAAAPTTISVYI